MGNTRSFQRWFSPRSSGPLTFYSTLDTDDEDGDNASSLTISSTSNDLAHFVRTRFGGFGSLVLCTSVSFVLFVFAVFGEQFSVVSAGVGGAPIDNHHPGVFVDTRNSSSSAIAAGGGGSALNSTTTNSTTSRLAPNFGSSHDPSSQTESKKSSIFYWSLAGGTLIVLLAIVRSLVILRRALAGGGGAGSRAVLFARRGGFPIGLSISDMIGGGGTGNLRSHLNLMGREINENDFEMLTQLDAINQLQDAIGRGGGSGTSGRGASEHTINRLPLHSISAAEIASKSDTNAQTCAVCMEPFEEGSLVRTVLCMHVFHQHCIDPWLRLHANCPICKSSVHSDQADEQWSE